MRPLPNFSLRKLPSIRSFTILALSLILSFFAEAQPPTDTPLNQTDAKKRRQGLWQKVHPETGNIAYRTTFKDDKPVGTTERYYEDGSLQASIRHRKDGVDAARLYYPEGGGLMALGNYQNQQRDSTWHLYTPDSVLAAREEYLDGKRHGTSITYYPDGSLSEKVTYRSGQKHGLWEQYYPDGILRLQATVEAGERYEGNYLSNYPNGKTMVKGRYEAGQKHGSWYHHHEDGAIEVIYVYREGKLESEHPQNGVFESHYSDDILRDSYTYKNGKKHGPFKEYYQQGEWRVEEATDQFGNTRPVQRLYGTQVMREGKYVEGELQGEVISYSEKGKVTRKEVYDKGVKTK